MQVVESNNIKPFDVDDTLVMHCSSPPKGNEAKEAILVKDPLNADRSIKVYRNAPMIRLMLEEYDRGATIVVWSRSGHRWAKNVVEALGLTAIVTLVMDKPMVYFDDKPIETWCRDRVYIDPQTTYKGV